MDSLIDPVYQAQNLMRASAPRNRFIQKKKPLHRATIYGTAAKAGRRYLAFDTAP